MSAEAPSARMAVPVTSESEEILQYIHPDLLKIDFKDRRVQLMVVAGSFLGFFAIFLTSYLVSHVFQFYQSLATKHKVFMGLAVVRSVYGVLSFIFGLYAILYDTSLATDVVYGWTASSAVAMYITIGFFIFELGSVLVSDFVFKTFSKLLLLHHGLGLAAYISAAIDGVSYSFGCRALVLELSTPFSCLCFVLLKAGMERSLLWKLNQLVLVHTFHVRSVVECYLWYVTYQHWGHIWAHMPAAVFVMLYANLVLVTFAMTPYWGYKKTLQLFNPVDWNFEDRNNKGNFEHKNNQNNFTTVSNGHKKAL